MVISVILANLDSTEVKNDEIDLVVFVQIPRS